MTLGAKGNLTLPSKHAIALRLLLSLLPLVVFIWILRKIELPLLPDARALSRVQWPLTVGYGAWFLLALLVRGIRWRWLVTSFAPMSLRTSLDLTSIGNAAIAVMPMRSGEVVRPLLARRHGISPLTVASTIGAERIIDGLAVGLIVTISLSLAPGHPAGFEILPPQFRDPALLPRVARLALVGFAAALAGLLLFYFNEPVMARLVRATVGRVSVRLAAKLTDLLKKIASGLSFLKNHGAAAVYLALTVVFWGMQLVAMHLLLAACGFEHVRFIESCAVTGVFALGFLLPSPPGFFGAFQTSLYAGLLLYFPTKQVTSEGACVVFFAYAIQLSLTILLGLVCYVREVFTRGKTRVAGVAVSDP